MGNDVRKITPEIFSILANPAVIAVNQDPLHSSAARRWLYPANSTHPLSRAEIQLWSGRLNSTTNSDYNDALVLFINGNDQSLNMNATLEEIFIDQEGEGSEISWEIRDLWGSRMNETAAKTVIDNAMGNGTTNGTVGMNMLYNATDVSYEAGLGDQVELLLGSVVGTVAPMGTIEAMVESHSVAMFRLRAQPQNKRKRDEL